MSLTSPASLERHCVHGMAQHVVRTSVIDTDMAWVGPMMQVALDDGSLAFSPVTNIPHSEPTEQYEYVQLRTASATVRNPAIRSFHRSSPCLRSGR